MPPNRPNRSELLILIPVNGRAAQYRQEGTIHDVVRAIEQLAATGTSPLAEP